MRPCDHATDCEHHRPPSDFGFLSLNDLQQALEIILDIGSAQDQIDELAGWEAAATAAIERGETLAGLDEGESVEQHRDWCAAYGRTWQAAQSEFLKDLMEWAGDVELGQNCLPLTPQDEARLLERVPEETAAVAHRILESITIAAGHETPAQAPFAT